MKGTHRYLLNKGFDFPAGAADPFMLQIRHGMQADDPKATQSKGTVVLPIASKL